MPNPLMTLGTFSFDGLESPERIQLKARQRVAIHHLGSGLSTIDYLGDDCETVSFRGIFSGTNAADRVRSINYLRSLGAPQLLSWNSATLWVIINQFELDYSSDRWIPYRLSCYVVRSVSTGAEDPTDVLSASPGTQVSDMFDLLTNSPISPTPGQAQALLTLATMNFDTPPSDMLQQARDLVASIEGQLAMLDEASQNLTLMDRGSSIGDASYISAIAENNGQQATLMLGCNRAMSIITYAENVNQQ
jgi:hypothetical protein